MRKKLVQMALIYTSALPSVIGGKQGTSAVISSPGCDLVNLP